MELEETIGRWADDIVARFADLPIGGSASFGDRREDLARDLIRIAGKLDDRGAGVLLDDFVRVLNLSIWTMDPELSVVWTDRGLLIRREAIS